VLEHMDDLVVSSAFRLGRREQFTAEHLQTRTSEELVADVKSRPRAYVAREALPRSTAPVWRNQSIQSSYVALRVFLAASNGSYRILPGGLVRVSPQSADLDPWQARGVRMRGSCQRGRFPRSACCIRQVRQCNCVVAVSSCPAV
jgi:uncharacterized circularly permuted ATP-grasp superfamily protein